MGINFTQEERTAAHEANLVEFLRKHGEEVKKVGTKNYWSYEGEVISINGNVWYNFYTQKGGEAIEFVQEYFDKTYAEAVAMLLDLKPHEIKEREVITKVAAPFILPERNDNNRRVFTYLTRTRGLDKDVVNTYIERNLIYEQATYHNAVFVGIDVDGNPRHAHMRGTGATSKFKMTTPRSDPNYSFHWYGTDNEVYLFEAPIDMLSFITMNPMGWMKHSYVAACSVADRALFQCLTDNPQIDTVHVCFDNDIAGKKAAERILDKLSKYNVVADILKSDLKDWNEDLTIPDGMQSTW